MAIFPEQEPGQALHTAYQHTRYHVAHDVDGPRAQVRHPAHALHVIAAAGVTDDEPHERPVQAERFVQVALGHGAWIPLPEPRQRHATWNPVTLPSPKIPLRCRRIVTDRPRFPKRVSRNRGSSAPSPPPPRHAAAQGP